jgi:hypothetical protein
MLQFETLPASLAGLLWAFRSCFTAPTFRTFAAVVAGMVAQPGAGTVCGMLVGAGLSRVWHHSRAHWFFAGARWCPQQVGLVLLSVIVQRLVPLADPLVIAVDDTLFRRAGRKVYAAAWFHDGAAKGPKNGRVGWGNSWVVAGVIVNLPFLDRPVCLPVATALCTKRSPSKQVLACRLVAAIAAACPDRRVHVVADAWYAGADGAGGATIGAARQRGLPAAVSLTSRLRANAALQAIAAPIPGAPGRPRRIGARLGSPAHLAATATWATTIVRRYGRDDTVAVAATTCLWYGVYRSRTIRVILVREPDSTATAGYDLALVTTDLTSPAEHIVARYAARWAIEVAFEDAKQITGVGQARNRTRTAVERTVPFGLFVQSLVMLWYALSGHHPDVTAHRRAAAPWYRSKTRPAYHDMIIKLRRVLIAAKFRAGKPRQPSPEEILAVHTAWAEAAA